jgi:hypothetical protein
MPIRNGTPKTTSAISHLLLCAESAFILFPSESSLISLPRPPPNGSRYHPVRDIVPVRGKSRRSLSGYRRLAGRDSPTKRTKPKSTKKAILAVRGPRLSPALRSSDGVHAVLGRVLFSLRYSPRSPHDFFERNIKLLNGFHNPMSMFICYISMKYPN